MARFNVALNQEHDDLDEAIINWSNGGDSIIVAGVAGQITRIYRFFLIVGGTTNITFKDEQTALTGPMPLVANEAIVFTFDTKPWYTCLAGDDFIINSSGAVQVSGRAYYTQTAA